MILLDTNIVSEVIRGRADTSVVDWLDNQFADDLYLCAPVIAELRYGVEKLPDSRRKENLSRRINDMVLHPFHQRVLPFDAPAAERLGVLLAHRERLGRPMQVMDGMIAAIALDRGARLATRNIAHFEQLNIDMVNPFLKTDMS